MTLASSDARMNALARALGNAESGAKEFREALKNVNREDFQIVGSLAVHAADTLLRHHILRASPTIADDISVVLAAFNRLDIPRADSEFGSLPNVAALRGALGNFRQDCNDILKAADALGWRPSKPELPDIGTIEVSRSGIEGMLKALIVRIESAEELLRRVVRPEGENTSGGTAVQIALVNVFVKNLGIELTLAKLEASAETIDFSALGRVIENVAELTANFAATVRGMAAKMTTTLQEASKQLTPKVRQVTRGFKTIIKRVVDLTNPPGPPPDFDLGTVHRMILKGEAPPLSWQPWIESLNLDGTPVTALIPLANLAELKMLDLNRTAVNDLAPLAELVALQTLLLNSTPVSDLAPIARLYDLKTLQLDRTMVSDLSPLARLVSLQTLYLGRTQVTDLAPLANLEALQTLSLNNTQTVDLTPLARLTALRALDLTHTPVINLDPLKGLAGLRTLTLNETLVTDLTPLASLTALRTLDLNGTKLKDLAPLANLKRLALINVESEKRRSALAKTLGPLGKIIQVRV